MGTTCSKCLDGDNRGTKNKTLSTTNSKGMNLFPRLCILLADLLSVGTLHYHENEKKIKDASFK